MDRRHFLKTASLLGASALVGPRAALAADNGFRPTPAAGWRIYEVTARAELAAAAAADGATRAWLPLPSVAVDDWIRPLGNLWRGNAADMRVERDPVYGATMLAAQWESGEAKPVVEVTSRFMVRDRAVDLSKPLKPKPLDKATARLYTRATELLPTDGIVRRTALEATRGARSDLDKARALYDWVVDNTARNPTTRGCGTGDIRGMLETGNLSGKCADLNALYVGLCRSVGVPARDVYGIRVADSRFGYKSLGRADNISKAQHCRAEVWLADFGWVPVDPADVRKVVLEEPPGNLTLSDEKVIAARETLFGAWEMNWLAYNFAHDLVLPGSKGPRLPFLMYPQAENAQERFDSLDPDRFRYSITSRDVTA